jgi:nucleotide-binding universal stress UspA family protein
LSYFQILNYDFAVNQEETSVPETDNTSNIILVAQDGSPPAQAAASVAIQIAQSRNLVIRGLYIVDEALVLDTYADYQTELGDIGKPVSRDDLVARFMERGETALQSLAARCQAAGVPVTTEIEFGGVLELLLQEAAQVELLALGRRGHRHAVDPHRLGGHFRAIAHRIQRPLLVGGDQQRPIQRLLLAYDGSETAQRALGWASLLQQALSARVIVLAVQASGETPGQWALELETQVAQSNLGHYEFLTRMGQPGAEIVAVAAENQVDMIVMGRYHHIPLLEWLAGSTVDKVLRNTGLPVLVA